MFRWWWTGLNIIITIPTLQLMMNILVELDYVSELRPPVGLLFIPQVIYEHGEPWWNDVEGKTDLSTRALPILPA
jgi:hypothetical protein